MSYTNETSYLKLPQYIGTDIPSILVDFNGAMSKIDTGVQTNADKASTAVETANQSKSLANAAQAQSEANSNSIGTLGTRVAALETQGGASEEELNEIRSNVTAAQTTATQAQTTANNARVAAQNAQTSANQNAASITVLNNQVADLQQSSGGGANCPFFSSAFMKTPGPSVNGTGTFSVMWAGEEAPGHGDLQCVGIIVPRGTWRFESTLGTSATVNGITVYPIAAAEGNVFDTPSYLWNNLFGASSAPMYEASESSAPSGSVTYIPCNFYYSNTENLTYLAVNMTNWGNIQGRRLPTAWVYSFTGAEV